MRGRKGGKERGGEETEGDLPEEEQEVMDG